MLLGSIYRDCHHNLYKLIRFFRIRAYWMSKREIGINEPGKLMRYVFTKELTMLARLYGESRRHVINPRHDRLNLMVSSNRIENRREALGQNVVCS